MTSRSQQIARLRCLSFLIDEALRIADEGELATVAAKLSEANDRVFHDLEGLGLPSYQPAIIKVLIVDGLDEK